MNPEDVEREVERLTDLLVPYLCERTGLQSAQIMAVLKANDEFWESQPSVISHMVLFELPDDEEPDGGSAQ